MSKPGKKNVQSPPSSASNASPSKASNANEVDSNIIQALVKGFDNYDSIRTYVDRRLEHFDRKYLI